ncbi:MAG: quinolinate synthase NadA [Candidatus Goldiibacteriota bacterium]
MDSEKILEKINKLRKEKKALIVAHNYQIPEVQDLADFTGDSLGLARKCADAEEQMIIFCGVKFMAETAKVLSPGKKVIIPRIDAGCPLADTITYDEMLEYREKYPDHTMVGYVNTNAEVKTLLDYCVTSANAVDIVKKIKNDKIVFVPDKNLGEWVKKNVPEKEIILHDGGCYVHHKFTAEDVDSSKKAHPDGVVLSHPECAAEVLDRSDAIASTSQMITYIKENPDKKKFIIGTEEGHIHAMKKARPDAVFYSLGTAKTCRNMKKTLLKDVLSALEKEETAVVLDEDIVKKAILPITRMVEL